MKRQRPVALVVVCDWGRAVAPPINALRWMLKRLGRVFGARCLSCQVIEAPIRPNRRRPR